MLHELTSRQSGNHLQQLLQEPTAHKGKSIHHWATCYSPNPTADQQVGRNTYMFSFQYFLPSPSVSVLLSLSLVWGAKRETFRGFPGGFHLYACVCVFVFGHCCSNRRKRTAVFCGCSDLCRRDPQLRGRERKHTALWYSLYWSASVSRSMQSSWSSQ